MAESDAPGSAGVRIPPPLLYAGGLAAGLLLGRGSMRGRDTMLTRVMGGLALAAAAGVGGSAVVTLKAAGTNVNPYTATKALVTGGVFRFSRNPVYVGLTSLYLGIALLARSLPALTFLPVVLALLDRLVVEREERYLERLFGDEYRAYRARVPRWF